MFTKTLVTRRSLLGGAALAAAAPLLVAGRSSFAADAPAGAKTTITLPDSSAYTQQPIRYGIEKGFFAEQGLDVKFSTIQDLVTGVGNGDLAYAFGPTNTYIRAAALGAPVKIVASGFRSKGPFFLIAKKGIKSVADLKGKTIGNAIPGSGLDLYLRVILAKNGLDAKHDVTYIANGVTEQAYGTLTTGQVDATIIHQPFAALGELEGVSTTLARGWDYLPTYHTGALIAGDDIIKNNPDVLVRGLRAYFKSYDYAKHHYDDYIPWLQKQLKIDPRAVKLAIEQEDDIWDANPAVDPVAIEDTQKLEIEWGNQKQVFDPKTFLDLRFIPQEYVKPFSYPAPPVISKS
jgi:ABC-type nitrate/sulfonate/bicarbonate transport system substrate-binding protein